MVEQEKDIRKPISQLLTGAGFEVSSAETSDQGLKLLELHKDAHALVIDAHVPGRIDGLELAHRARPLRPNLALVLMFGYSDHISRPLPQGAEFVLKPNVGANLVPTLRRMREG